MQDASSYGLLAGVFVLSRIGYYLLGVRFDARPIQHYFQFIDPYLLTHRLLESMLYLHVQPPGWNLYTGIGLKLFPQSYAAAFHAVHLALGLATCWLIFYLMRALAVHRRIAFALAAWFTISPAVVLFENFMLYEYMVSFLLVAAAAALWRSTVKDSTPRLTLFFLLLLALVLFRNFFHLLYFIAILGALVYFSRHRRRVLLAAALPLSIILALYAKNWILFGSFSGSTWLGMSMDTISSHQLTSAEVHDLVARRVISPVSLFDVGTALALYQPYIQMPARTGIPVLDDCATSTGAVNFNCLAFREVQRAYIHDGIALLRNYPVVYLRSSEAAWFSYFLPASDFPFFELNRPRIFGIDRFWNALFFGQLKDAGDRKELRRLAAEHGPASLLPHTGIFLMIGLPALWIFGAAYLVRGMRRRTLSRQSAILIAFLLFNIIYLTALVNLLSSFENNRYRFSFDAFYVVLLGLAIDRLIRKFRPHGTATACNAVVVTTLPLPSKRSIT